MATSRYIKVKEKKENKWLIPSFVCLFTLLGVAFATGGFSYGRYIAILVVGFGVLLDIDDTFCLLCFCLPFAGLLKFSQESTTIIAVLYIIILFKLMSREKMNVPAIAFFSFLVLAAMQTFTIFFYNSIITNVFSTLLNIAFVLFISEYFSSREFKNPQLLTSAAMCISLSCALMLLLCDIFPRITLLVHTSSETLIKADRYGAAVLDPNELAQLILISICLLIAIIPSFQSVNSKFLGAVMIIYMAITGIRTHSKSYVISISLLLVLFFFSYLRMVAKKEGSYSAFTKLIPLLFVAIIGAILIVNYIAIPIFEARSTEQTDLFTNRTNIWIRYILALFQSPDVLLIGSGANNVTGLLRLAGSDSSTVPHNFYLEYIIQFGIGGLTMLFLCWKKIFVAIKDKTNTYFFLALMAFLITGFGISVNASDSLFILLALLSIPLPEELNQQVISTKKMKPSTVRRPL